MLRFGKDKIEDLDIDVTQGHLYEPIPNDEKWKINIINELVDVREGIKILPHFGYEEINSYLDYVCMHEAFIPPDVIKPFLCLNK